jgi:ornithine carbamoyltransferase
MLADVMTMREHSDKPVGVINYAYVGRHGDPTWATAQDRGLGLMAWTSASCGPRKLWPEATIPGRSRASSRRSTGEAHDQRRPGCRREGRRLITRCKVSMVEPKEVWKERSRCTTPYHVKARLIEATGNPA